MINLAKSYSTPIGISNNSEFAAYREQAKLLQTQGTKLIPIIEDKSKSNAEIYNSVRDMVGADPIKVTPDTLVGRLYDRVGTNPDQFKKLIKPASGGYTDTLQDIYNIYNTGVAILGTSVPFAGYKNVLGLSLSDTAHWDIKMAPYTGSGEYNGPPNPFNWFPIIRYSLSYDSLDTHQVQLNKSNSINIPSGYKFATTLSLTILENRSLTIKQWLKDYMNALYNPDTGIGQPYLNVCQSIYIYSYDIERVVMNTMGFIGYPEFDITFEGSSDHSAASYTVNFNLVGKFEDQYADSMLRSLSSFDQALDSVKSSIDISGWF